MLSLGHPVQVCSLYNKIPTVSICRHANKDQWSRRQAELFIATQAALLTSNEQEALKPPELHNHITNLLKTNPDLAEAVSIALR